MKYSHNWLQNNLVLLIYNLNQFVIMASKQK